MKKTIILTGIALFFGVQLSQAQTCPSTLESKSGKVFSANPGIVKATSNEDEVVVKVKKTDGRAETQVNIYVGGVFKAKIEFDNGNYTTQWKTRTVTGAKNKEVKVEIVNQSVAHTFSYDARIEGSRRSLMTTGGPETGNLVGQTQKTVYSNGSCTGKAKVIVTRQSGNARGTVRIFEKQGNSWNNNPAHSVTFEANENKKEILVNSNKDLKVELKNISVGNMLGYRLNVQVN